MIKVKHFSHQFHNCNDVYPLLDDFGKSNTDTSKWRPDISIARAQLNAMNSGKTLLYDFPDGKDNGQVVQTFLRSPALDITEVETAEKRVTTIIEDKVEKDRLKADKENRRKQNLKDLSDSIADSLAAPAES